MSKSRVLAALTGLQIDPVVPVARSRSAHATLPQVAPAPPLRTTRSEPAPAPATLPIYSYKSLSPAPTMHFIRTEADVAKHLSKLDTSGPLSVDFEWAVPRRRGVPSPLVSLVQVASSNTILVIQLLSGASTSMSRFPRPLQRILEDPDIPKAGANILGDAKKLFRDYGIMMAGAVELGALARQADPSCTSPTVWGSGKKLVALAKLVERYLHKSLSKESNVRLSNWEDPTLDKKPLMLDYAANDAYAGYQVFTHLLRLAKAASITLAPEKYTSQVYHASLAPPKAPQPPALSMSDPIPRLDLTPDMSAAGVSPQQLRAYRHWALAHRPLDSICAELRIDKTGGAGPLKRATVISYIVTALELWPRRPLTYDLGALRLLIQEDLRSWDRHYPWLLKQAGIES